MIVYWNTAGFAMLIAPQTSAQFAPWFYLIFLSRQTPSPQLSQIAAGGLLLARNFQWTLPSLSLDSDCGSLMEMTNSPFPQTTTLRLPPCLPLALGGSTCVPCLLKLVWICPSFTSHCATQSSKSGCVYSHLSYRDIPSSSRRFRLVHRTHLSFLLVCIVLYHLRFVNTFYRIFLRIFEKTPSGHWAHTRQKTQLMQAI